MKPDDKLPLEFRKYFWDCEFSDLNFDKYPRFISERLLNYGDINSLKWLLSLTNRKFLKNIVKTSRNLNNKTKNYWELILF
jgi:hypothetical protein